MDIKSIKEHLGQDWTALQERIVGALKSDIDLLNITNASISVLQWLALIMTAPSEGMFSVPQISSLR